MPESEQQVASAVPLEGADDVVGDEQSGVSVFIDEPGPATELPHVGAENPSLSDGLDRGESGPPGADSGSVGEL